ncbi:MAG: hypothetical protein H6708_01425 [Kofleriaceae bacterium]|nr:hypothetical protein [Myxococcales bacterium]MCB9559050.1 hypothetical protein [Kofleriaceae bacterium]
MKRLACPVLLALVICGCGGDDAASPDAAPRPDATVADAPPGPCVVETPTPTPLTCPGVAGATSSNIAHLVVIIQENQSFDTYFGNYCTAAPGSEPTCTTGPSCCEAAPATEPMGASPLVLDDAQHRGFDPNHNYDCNILEVNGGLMDGFVTGEALCASPNNFAIATTSGPVAPYHTLAGTGALADRYFQPVLGASSSNDMYFARAGFVFKDNEVQTTSIGSNCGVGSSNPQDYDDPTIGDLLEQCDVPWTWYGGGYQVMLDAVANGTCPLADPACPVNFAFYPCIYDPTDVPFQYYPTLQNDPAHFQDLTQFYTDVTDGTLPAISYIKQIGFLTEHSGFQVDISSGVAATQQVVDAISNSATYADDTLILLTYDEGGGYFDHVPPPPTSTADCQPYGVRVPFMALGPFAKTNHISHVTMEHSSIVKFMEWNWLGGQTGQLGTRDGQVNNIGDLLDPTTTGTAVPAN